MAKANVRPAKRRIAIAYEWLLTPVDFHEYDLVLIIACVDSERPEPSVCVYHSLLPEKRYPSRQSDISGNLGIIFPISDDSVGRRASSSERLVADAITWELAKLKFGESDTLLLLQGPMLPKLRGRLLYRGVPKSVAIWTLTWQPEWFWRMEASQQLLRNTESTIGISPMYPPKGIDRSSRCWVGRRDEKSVYHFEVLTDVWNCIVEEDWVEKCTADIQAMVSSANADTEDMISLPHGLQQARAAAKERWELEREFAWFLPRLRERKHDVAELCNGEERLQRVVESIDPQAAIATMELFASTKTFNWAKEDDVYTAFINQGSHLLDILRSHDA
jgi:hypothetical protein